MQQKAYIACGCFWGIEEFYRTFDGVISTSVGYGQGHKKDPTYQEVCQDSTGHAEVVEIEYDDTKTTYEKIIRAFFQIHDPTQLNRQGPDIGTQYRSGIYFLNEDQKEIAEAIIAELEELKTFSDPIVTELEAFKNYYPAEEYHQKYFFKRGQPAACLFSSKN